MVSEQAMLQGDFRMKKRAWKGLVIAAAAITLGAGLLFASIEIPASVTKIEEGAFRRCGGLENITVAEGNPVYHSADN